MSMMSANRPTRIKLFWNDVPMNEMPKEKEKIPIISVNYRAKDLLTVKCAIARSYRKSLQEPLYIVEKIFLCLANGDVLEITEHNWDNVGRCLFGRDTNLPKFAEPLCMEVHVRIDNAVVRATSRTHSRCGKTEKILGTENESSTTTARSVIKSATPLKVRSITPLLGRSTSRGRCGRVSVATGNTSAVTGNVSITAGSVRPAPVRDFIPLGQAQVSTVTPGPEKENNTNEDGDYNDCDPDSVSEVVVDATSLNIMQDNEGCMTYDTINPSTPIINPSTPIVTAKKEQRARHSVIVDPQHKNFHREVAERRKSLSGQKLALSSASAVWRQVPGHDDDAHTTTTRTTSMSSSGEFTDEEEEEEFEDVLSDEEENEVTTVLCDKASFQNSYESSSCSDNSNNNSSHYDDFDTTTPAAFLAFSSPSPKQQQLVAEVVDDDKFYSCKSTAAVPRVVTAVTAGLGTTVAAVVESIRDESSSSERVSDMAVNLALYLNNESTTTMSSTASTITTNNNMNDSSSTDTNNNNSSSSDQPSSSALTAVAAMVAAAVVPVIPTTVAATIATSKSSCNSSSHRSASSSSSANRATSASRVAAMRATKRIAADKESITAKSAVPTTPLQYPHHSSSSSSSSTATTTTYKHQTPYYPQGRTLAESSISFNQSLRNYTNAASASFSSSKRQHILVDTVSSAAKKRIANTYVCNTATTDQQLSPPPFSLNNNNKGKSDNTDADGRPSIGTLTNQWIFMKNICFNGNEEELQWSMKSKGNGAYAYAHQRVQAAEDQYYKCIYETAVLDNKLTLLTEGEGATLISLVHQLNNLYTAFQSNSSSTEIIEKISTAHAELKTLVFTYNTAMTASNLASNRIAVGSLLGNFSSTVEIKLRGILETEDRAKIVQKARGVVQSVDAEVKNVREQQVAINKEMAAAEANMEKWTKRERETDDYSSIMREEETAWLQTQEANNLNALSTMREYIPVNITELKVNELMEFARQRGGLLSQELASELKQNRLLHWIVTHTEDIAMANFLTGNTVNYFQDIEQLDIIELRAIAVCLPAKFELDNDGKKAEWRSRFMARVKQLVSQDSGEKVKGGWDGLLGKRSMIQQQALRPEQQRRSVYYYRTVEQSDVKLKQYDDKIAMLAKKRAALTVAEAEASEAKVEYDIVLRESRDPDFIEMYGASKIAEAKELAKKMLAAADRKLKTLSQDEKRLAKTIEEMPISRDQYAAMIDELKEYLITSKNIDWTEKGRKAIMIEGVFDPLPEINKLDRSAAKFVSAEEEAALRKQELSMLLTGRKAVSEDEVDIAAAMMGCSLNGSSKNNMNSISGIIDGMADDGDFSATTITNGVDNEDNSSNNNNNNSVATTISSMMPGAVVRAVSVNRRASICSNNNIGFMSPVIRRSFTENGERDYNNAENDEDDAVNAVLATPTTSRKYSVLSKANPDVLNTLTKMFGGNCATTPAPATINRRASMTPLQRRPSSMLASASAKLFGAGTAKDDSSAITAEEEEEQRKERAKKLMAANKKTSSKVLQQLLQPTCSSRSPNQLSPKRSNSCIIGGSASKCITPGGFLQQLAAQAAKKQSKRDAAAAAATAESTGSVDTPSASSAAATSSTVMPTNAMATTVPANSTGSTGNSNIITIAPKALFAERVASHPFDNNQKHHFDDVDDDSNSSSKENSCNQNNNICI